MWKESERLQLAEENRRILEFAKQQQTRESDRMAVRIAEEEAKAKVRSDLADKLARQNQDREELQQYVIFHKFSNLLICRVSELQIYVSLKIGLYMKVIASENLKMPVSFLVSENDAVHWLNLFGDFSRPMKLPPNCKKFKNLQNL